MLPGKEVGQIFAWIIFYSGSATLFRKKIKKILQSHEFLDYPVSENHLGCLLEYQVEYQWEFHLECQLECLMECHLEHLENIF